MEFGREGRRAHQSVPESSVLSLHSDRSLYSALQVEKQPGAMSEVAKRLENA